MVFFSLRPHGPINPHFHIYSEAFLVSNEFDATFYQSNHLVRLFVSLYLCDEITAIESVTIKCMYVSGFV